MRLDFAKLGALMVAMLCGCGQEPSRSDYIEIHQDGIRTLPCALQIDEHYGRDHVDHFITHFGLRGEPLTWNSEVHFGGRFVLTLQVPVRVDYASNKVATAGEPKFFLHAFSKIDQLPDGRYSASYAGELHLHFDEALWNRFVDADFDLAVLKVEDDEQYPIDRFDQRVRAVRNLRQQIPMQTKQQAE